MDLFIGLPFQCTLKTVFGLSHGLGLFIGLSFQLSPSPKECLPNSCGDVVMWRCELTHATVEVRPIVFLILPQNKMIFRKPNDQQD